MTNTDKYLTAQFDKARKALPELMANTTPVGAGGFGIVVAHNNRNGNNGNDDTLTKIIFRPQNIEWHKPAQMSFANEVHALQIFAANPITDIQTPVLVGKPEILTHKDYMAAYRMTRIPGKSYSYFMPHDNNPSAAKTIHKNAGQALAKFHKAAEQMSFEKLHETPDYEDDEIIQVDILGAATNKALAKANDYLQTHMKSGVIHGDYHGGNIMMDADYNVTGLIDFSRTGKNKNFFLDLANSYQDYKGDFIHGYEEESNMVVDMHMVSVSALASWTNYLNKIKGTIFNHTKPIKEINGFLNDIVPITGFRP